MVSLAFTLRTERVGRQVGRGYPSTRSSYAVSMPRPRIYDPDMVLDAVESLAVKSGPAAVTIRAISAAVGVSNGALYHTFGSRAELMGRAWLRAGYRLLAVQNSLISQALSSTGNHSGIDAVVAAAAAPVVFSQQHPDSSNLFLAVRREEILADNMRAETATELKDLDKLLVGTLIMLAVGVWDRKDAAAVDVITTCVVDLPTSILLRRNRISSKIAREHLQAAVLAVLAIGPPPRRHRLS
jgi:AcrR family transcriptional regulator